MKILLAVIVVAVVIQFFRPDFSSPPVDPHNAIQAPPDVQAILERSCYDCHSSRTRLPWYSNVAPVSWLLARDINEGRRDLSFSEFATYSPKKAARRMQQICEEVKDGGMPPWYYTPMHPASKLSAADRQAICAWSTPLSHP